MPINIYLYSYNIDSRPLKDPMVNSHLRDPLFFALLFSNVSRVNGHLSVCSRTFPFRKGSGVYHEYALNYLLELHKYGPAG